MIKDVCFIDNLNGSQMQEISSLSLAFLGDGVWSVMVREYLLSHSTYKNTTLHKLATKFVKASYQAEFFDLIEKDLSEQELLIAKRARNCKMNTIAKHSTLSEYKKATSLEALVGHYYLTGEFEKLKNLYVLLTNDIKKALLEGIKR